LGQGDSPKVVAFAAEFYKRKTEEQGWNSPANAGKKGRKKGGK
jgi:hypothetical protein